MSKFKRVTSGLVGVAMAASMFTSMPFSAFAEDEAETNNQTYVYDDYEVSYQVTNSWGDLDVAAENVFYYDTEENCITITGSSLKSVESIPDELENLPVKELSSRAFFACTNSESSITIPETVEVIGDECFLGVIGSGYTTYFLPASIQSIGDYALGYTCYENYQEGCVIGDKIEKLKNVVIYGYSNTVAETYATENGFTFVALNNSVSGDVNNDGNITIADAVLLQKWLLSVPNTTLPNWKAADLYKDERLDVFDLCLLKRMLIEL